MVAAPLLDSSSGWACTAMRRICSVTGRTPCRRLAGAGCQTVKTRSVPAAWMDLAILADATDNKRTRGRQVSETRTTEPVFPPGRYGRRRSGQRFQAAPIIVLAVVIAASLLLSVKLYQRFGQTDYKSQI